jgi:transposase InsO family protein
MGRVGSALDNAVIESWNSTLEFELRGLEHFATKAQARRRPHASLAYNPYRVGENQKTSTNNNQHH